MASYLLGLAIISVLGLTLGLTAPAYGNISTPEPTASISDGDRIGEATFAELDGATDIVTVKIGGSTYAVVAAKNDDGIQIIDITNPGVPVAVAAVTDGERSRAGGTFSELDAATDVAIVEMVIGDRLRTYAVVAADRDDGVQIIDISDPYSPVPVVAITDEQWIPPNKRFDTLDNPMGVATTKIGESTYALVTSFYDDGVQIIDISDPYFPTPVTSIHDGQQHERGGTFSELDGAVGITTTKMNINDEIRTLALVASFHDDGVQIIDITDPHFPIAVAAIADGQQSRGSTFSELDGAWGITTVKIGSNTYAVVAADSDDGVQIIDITNPAAPLPTAAITDGQKDSNTKTFDRLGNAKGVTTAKVGDRTYAVVAAERDDGFQIIDMTNPRDPKSVASRYDGFGNNLYAELDGAVGVTTVMLSEVTGDVMYALVASNRDDGVQMVRMFDSSHSYRISPGIYITDGQEGGGGTFSELDGAFDVTTFKLGQETYAVVAADSDDGVQIIDITDPAHPLPTASIYNGQRDGGKTFDMLDNPKGVATTKIGESTYALVTSNRDSGVQIINLHTPHHPRIATSIHDGQEHSREGTFSELAGAFDVTTVKMRGNTYAVITADRDDGIQIINVNNPRHPVPVFAITDGQQDSDGNTFDTLDNPRGVTTVTIGNHTYALVTSYYDDGIQIIDMTYPHFPKAVASVTDGQRDTRGVAFSELDGAFDVTAVTIGHRTYAVVAADHDDGIQIIDITDPANPLSSVAITDGQRDFDTLDNPRGVTTTTIDGSTYALVTSYYDDGVQIIDLTHSSRAVTSITDGQWLGNKTFDELDGALGITTVRIDDDLYAVVAAESDNGVQIINLSTTTVKYW